MPWGMILIGTLLAVLGFLLIWLLIFRPVRKSREGERRRRPAGEQLKR